MQAWSTPFWAPYYRETGYLVATSPSAPVKAKQSLQRSLRSLTDPNSKFPRDSIVPISSRDDIMTLAPTVQGPANGWTGYLNRKAGYAQAAPALKAVYNECLRLGVKFVLGEDGHATELLCDASSGELSAVKTLRGAYSADVTILCLGAHSASLLPIAGLQITAKAWSVGHIQLSPSECRQLAGIPVINCRDIGFLFEPDMETGLLKISANSAGYVNHVDTQGRKASIPSASNAGIPVEDEARIRQLVREIFPYLAARPLVHKFICWCGDTVDSNYIIDNVPRHAGSGGSRAKAPRLIMASGDSGHAFKMLPVIGQWVVKVLKDGEQKIKKWKWKNISESENGNDISWRVGQVKEIGNQMRWSFDSKREYKI